MKTLVTILASLPILAIVGCGGGSTESAEPIYLDAPQSMPAPPLIDRDRATTMDKAKEIIGTQEDVVGICRQGMEAFGAHEASATNECEAVQKGQGPTYRPVQDWQAPLLLENGPTAEIQASMQYLTLATFRARYECESALVAKLLERGERFTGKDVAYLLNEGEYHLNAHELPIGREISSRYHTTREDTGESNAWTVDCYFDFDKWQITSLSNVRVLGQ